MDASGVAKWVLLAILVVAGLVLWVGGTVDVLRQAETVESAERTEGVVTSFSFRPTDGYTGGPNTKTEKFEFTVQYRYVVDGTTYRSQTLKPRYVTDTVLINASVFWWDGPGRVQVDTRKQGRAYGERFTAGEPVTVYYDPEDPSSSFLLRWYSISPYLVALGGLFLLSAAPFPMAVVGVTGWVEKRVGHDDPAVADGETPGVDVPVLSALDLPPAVERVVPVAPWAGLGAVLLWYPVHFWSRGDLVGVGVLVVVSALTLHVCRHVADLVA